MKTNNRPTEKYSYRTFDGEHKTELIPISDAKYIEYLEEQVSDTFGKLVSVEELSKQTISTLEKENKELKEMLKDRHNINVEKDRCLALASELAVELEQQQDQFLKVVESVLYEHTLDFDLMCMKSSCDNATKTYREHLLQEIKSAIEKEGE